MTRSIITLTTLSAMLVSTLTPQVHAHGCSTRYRRSSYSRHRTVRVVRPITVVRPVVVAQPTVVPPREEIPTVPTGSTMTLPANFLGPAPGSVFMVFNKIKLPVVIQQWTTSAVTIELPPMAIKDAVVIRVDIVLPDGKLGHSQKLRVTAPAPVVLHPVLPTAPLPTQSTLAPVPNPSPAIAQRVSNLAVGGPIVLPAAQPAAAFAQPAAAIPQLASSPASPSPIVLPAVSRPTGQPAAVASMQGNGTPSQPFVLPTAQPANVAQPSTVVPPAVVQVVTPPAVVQVVTPPTGVQVVTPPTRVTEQATSEVASGWLENNPILLEGQTAESPVSVPATEAIEPASQPRQITVNGMTSVLAIMAKTLLSK